MSGVKESFFTEALARAQHVLTPLLTNPLKLAISQNQTLMFGQ